MLTLQPGGSPPGPASHPARGCQSATAAGTVASPHAGETSPSPLRRPGLGQVRTCRDDWFIGEHIDARRGMLAHASTWPAIIVRAGLRAAGSHGMGRWSRPGRDGGPWAGCAPGRRTREQRNSSGRGRPVHRRGRPGGSGRGRCAPDNRRHRPAPAAPLTRPQRRAAEPGAAARRSERASRMRRDRREQRPGGVAGRTGR